MSKLTHNQAIKRHRKNRKVSRVRKAYTRQQMKELMPGFVGAKPMPLERELESTLSVSENESFKVFVKLDRNGQICDCTRIGNVFSKLYGKSPKVVDWCGHMYEEAIRVKRLTEWNS